MFSKRLVNDHRYAFIVWLKFEQIEKKVIEYKHHLRFYKDSPDHDGDSRVTPVLQSLAKRSAELARFGHSEMLKIKR